MSPTEIIWRGPRVKSKKKQLPLPFADEATKTEDQLERVVTKRAGPVCWQQLFTHYRNGFSRALLNGDIELAKAWMRGMVRTQTYLQPASSARVGGRS